MKLPFLFLPVVLLSGLATASLAQEAPRLPWYGQDGPLVRSDGNAWRPEYQIELTLPLLAQPEAFRTAVPFDGEWVELDLRPYSVRGTDFRLLVSDELGEVREVVAPAPRTYRGTIVDRSDSHVTASLDEEGRLRASIETPTSAWYVRPLSDFVPGAGPLQHAVFSRWNDAVGRGGFCGVAEGPEAEEPNATPPPPDGAKTPDDTANGTRGPRERRSGGGGSGGSPLPFTVGYRAGAIAIHVRPDYYAWAGGSTGSVLADIDDLMNNVQREYDEGPHLNAFKFNVIGVLLETSSSLLTPSNDKDQLIGSLESVWTVHGYFGLDPDFVHLLTTELEPGGTIGYGNTGGTCPGPAFGISETDFATGFANTMKYRAWLTAHELGHNLGANHDGNCGGLFDDTCQIMCPGVDIIGCAAIGISWSQQAANSVNAHMAQSCFDQAIGTVYAKAGSNYPFPDGTAALPWGSIAAARPHLSPLLPGWTLALYSSSFNEGVVVIDQLMTITAVGGPAIIE